MRTAKLATLHVTRELTREHEPLIARELRCYLADAAQVVAQHREPLDVGARIGDLDFAAFAIGDWKRVSDRRLDRTAPAECAAAVVHPREQPLLERIGYMGVAGKRLTAICACQQLERRLAVTVFEILTDETATMDRKQHLSTRARDEGNRFGPIEQAVAPGPTG